MIGSTLSIIVPAYNEELRLGDSTREILRYIRDKNISAELIITDDGSTDATASVAKEACAEFPEIRTNVIRYDKNRGKGFAVKTGFIYSKNDIAIFSDADLSTPISELPRLVKPIENGEFDVTLGSRALDRKLIEIRQPWQREQGGKVFNWLVKKLIGLPFEDTQCGFKAFNMKKFRPLLDKMTIDRFGFDIEFIYAAFQAKLLIKEVPVCWRHCEGTKVSIFRDGLRMFGEINRLRKNAKLKIYKLET
jgi:dolichyl-phosphate beta-glucosyltransferase